MLTLFPPTWGVDSKPEGSNGSNGVVFVYYWRGHPYAKAIAAQEVREGRPKFIAAVLAFAAFTVAAYFLAPDLQAPRIAIALLAGLIGVAVVALAFKFPALARGTELRGQSVECVVRRDHYQTPLDFSLDQAAQQLAGYPQFDADRFHPGDVAEIRAQLLRAIPAAEKWAKRNANLIAKA